MHAVIEADNKNGEVSLYDNKSKNYTWKDGKKLKPEVRYNLTGGESLKFGNASATFQIQAHAYEDRISNNQSTPLANTSKYFIHIWRICRIHLFLWLSFLRTAGLFPTGIVSRSVLI